MWVEARVEGPLDAFGLNVCHMGTCGCRDQGSMTRWSLLALWSVGTSMHSSAEPSELAWAQEAGDLC